RRAGARTTELARAQPFHPAAVAATRGDDPAPGVRPGQDQVTGSGRVTSPAQKARPVQNAGPAQNSAVARSRRALATASEPSGASWNRSTSRARTVSLS